MATLTTILPDILTDILRNIGAIKTYSGDFPREYVETDVLYGRTDPDIRAMMSGVVSAARHGDDPFLRACGERAQKWGHESYAYAGGWYDALKRSKPNEWQQAALDGMWYFGIEAEFAEFCFAAELTGCRAGYGGAWVKYLEARGLAD